MLTANTLSRAYIKDRQRFPAELEVKVFIPIPIFFFPISYFLRQFPRSILDHSLWRYSSPIHRLGVQNHREYISDY